MSQISDRQLLLFDPEKLPMKHRLVLGHYASARQLSIDQDDLYEAEARRRGIDLSEMKARVPIGTSGTGRQPLHAPHTRQVRWWQQELKAKGWLEPVPGHRGRWRLTEPARMALTPQQPGRVMLGVSTELGVALWANAEDVFGRLDEPITLVLTSPPYPLATPRAYGNVPLSRYVEWLVGMLEPLAKRLRQGGTIAINISNDIFEPGSPARSTYRERLVIALCDELALFKWDEFIWHNPSKAPGPIQWASRTQQQLNVAWEPVYIFTNDPHRCLASNRRVLQTHTAKQIELMRTGGERVGGCFSDGAYRRKEGAFGRVTEGRIPRNLQSITHHGKDPVLAQAKRMAKVQGLPVHGAPMPLDLADFLVRYLSAEGDLVVDPFGGWGTTGIAAEQTGRRWMSTEKHVEYIHGTVIRHDVQTQISAKENARREHRS